MMTVARELLSRGVPSGAATVLQSSARGKLMRQASNNIVARHAVVGDGTGAHLLTTESSSPTPLRRRSSSLVGEGLVDVRRPVFKLVPHEDDLIKLNAKLKAKQRAILFGGQSTMNLRVDVISFPAP